MAPKKTYFNKSIDVVNALFAENLYKRKKTVTLTKKKNTLKIKELPKRKQISRLLEDSDSLIVNVQNADNTFDRLLRESKPEQRNSCSEGSRNRKNVFRKGGVRGGYSSNKVAGSQDDLSSATCSESSSVNVFADSTKKGPSESVMKVGDSFCLHNNESASLHKVGNDSSCLNQSVHVNSITRDDTFSLSAVCNETSHVNNCSSKNLSKVGNDLSCLPRVYATSHSKDSSGSNNNKPSHLNVPNKIKLNKVGTTTIAKQVANDSSLAIYCDNKDGRNKQSESSLSFSDGSRNHYPIVTRSRSRNSNTVQIDTFDQSVELNLEIEYVHKWVQSANTLNLVCDKFSINNSGEKRMLPDSRLVCSTPFAPKSNKNTVYNESLVSPIAKKLNCTDMHLLEESLQQIEEWNFKAPDFKNVRTRNQKRRASQRSSTPCRSKSINDKFKLNSTPKVSINKMNAKQNQQPAIDLEREVFVKITKLPNDLINSKLDGNHSILLKVNEFQMLVDSCGEDISSVVSSRNVKDISITSVPLDDFENFAMALSTSDCFDDLKDCEVSEVTIDDPDINQPRDKQNRNNIDKFISKRQNRKKKWQNLSDSSVVTRSRSKNDKSIELEISKTWASMSDKSNSENKKISPVVKSYVTKRNKKKGPPTSSIRTRNQLKTLQLSETVSNLSNNTVNNSRTEHSVFQKSKSNFEELSSIPILSPVRRNRRALKSLDFVPNNAINKSHKHSNTEYSVHRKSTSQLEEHNNSNKNMHTPMLLPLPRTRRALLKELERSSILSNSAMNESHRYTINDSNTNTEFSVHRKSTSQLVEHNNSKINTYSPIQSIVPRTRNQRKAMDIIKKRESNLISSLIDTSKTDTSPISLIRINKNHKTSKDTTFDSSKPSLSIIPLAKTPKNAKEAKTAPVLSSITISNNGNRPNETINTSETKAPLVLLSRIMNSSENSLCSGNRRRYTDISITHPSTDHSLRRSFSFLENETKSGEFVNMNSRKRTYNESSSNQPFVNINMHFINKSDGHNIFKTPSMKIEEIGSPATMKTERDDSNSLVVLNVSKINTPSKLTQGQLRRVTNSSLKKQTGQHPAEPLSTESRISILDPHISKLTRTSKCSVSNDLNSCDLNKRSNTRKRISSTRKGRDRDNSLVIDLTREMKIESSVEIIEDSFDDWNMGPNNRNSKRFMKPLPPARAFIKAGKMWRRSLSTYKKNTFVLKMSSTPTQTTCGANEGPCTCQQCKQKELLELSVCRKSIKLIPESTRKTSSNKRKSLIETYATGTFPGYAPNNIQGTLEQILEGLSVNRSEAQLSIEEENEQNDPFVTARDIVLRRCGQNEPVAFSECYPQAMLKNCHKIGEGVYGEVFLFRNKTGTTSVMKVIPIEGDLIVNGERQKKFEEILTEIIIAMELSDLRKNKKNSTSGFNEVCSIHCVKGQYPARLLDLWDLYNEDRGSENDCPDVFGPDQIYVVLELTNGGKDLESYVFNNALQAYSLFQQAACSLAVAEVALQFEHRDLHWGNILISAADKNTKLTYNLNGRQIDVPSNGVQISIIDFTLSRITFDGICIYNDLGQDPELFDAQGDYQFEIYRLMQKCNVNEWQPFEPYTNILWLHYTLDKMITALRYKYPQTKCHNVYIDKLKQLKEQILEFKSVEEFVTQTFV